MKEWKNLALNIFQFPWTVHLKMTTWPSCSSANYKPPNCKHCFGHRVLFTSNAQMWVGGYWQRVVPNFYTKSLFLWHIWPLFVNNLRKIHFPNLTFWVPNLWGGWVGGRAHKFGPFVTNKTVFFGVASPMQISLGGTSLHWDSAVTVEQLKFE